LAYGLNALENEAMQLSSFALACLNQFLECLVEQGQGLGFGTIGDLIAVTQHTWPFQDVDNRQRRTAAGKVKNFAACVIEPNHQILVNTQGAAVIFFHFQTKLAVDLAASDGFTQHVAYGGLQRPQGIRQAQAGFEVAMIDRADLPHQDGTANSSLPSSEGGHAQYHKRTPWEPPDNRVSQRL